MQEILETLAGATEFDGTAGAGLIDFSDLSLDPSLGFKATIVNISLDTGDTAMTLPQITVLARLVGGAASAVARMVNVQDQSGFAKLGCSIPIPRTNAGATWVVQVLTPGKLVAATLKVEYTQQYWGGADG